MASPVARGSLGEPFGVDIGVARNSQAGRVAVRGRAAFERAAA